MGIQAFVPSGGGGTPGFDYIASIRMETYNRSWTQAGAPGNYIVTSNLSNPGYAYFVGSSTTTGTPLNKIINLTHSFTRIDIVAPSGDYVSLFKAAVKSTTIFANPFASFSSFPSTITSSGNFVLPTSALPLVSALVVGGGGGGGGNHRGGGGGGAAIVKLEGYQAVGTTAVTIGGGGSHGNNNGGSRGGTTYFGNVYATGGGGGSGDSVGAAGSNGGGGNAHNGASNGGVTSISENGSGTQTGTATVLGGNHGYNHNSYWGGGGGGAGGAGGSNGHQGVGHYSTIQGPNNEFAAGGTGGSHSPNQGLGGHNTHGSYGNGGHGAHSNCCNSSSGTNGVVIVRYYIT